MFHVSILVLSMLVTPPPATMAAPEAPAEDEFDPAKSIQACESGGDGAPTCSAACHKVFNFYTTQCSVSCRSGYYACCGCERGCDCVIDHDELWPWPADKIPGPLY